MHDDLWIAVIAAVASILTMLLQIRNAGMIQQVHLTMNSRMDELVAASKKESFAEGERSAVATAEAAASVIVKAAAETAAQVAATAVNTAAQVAAVAAPVAAAAAIAAIKETMMSPQAPVSDTLETRDGLV